MRTRKGLFLYCLCFLLLLVFTPLFAQLNMDLFNEKWKQAKAHLDSNRIEALLTATKGLESLLQDKHSKTYGKVAYLYAEYFYAKDNWKQTIQYADQAIKLLEKNTTDRLLLAESHLLGGLAYDYLKEFETAIPYYQKALSIKKEVLGPHHLKVSNIYYNLGIIEEEKRNLEKAIQFLKQGISGILEAEGKGSPHLIDFYNKVGYLYRLKGNFDAALDFRGKALSIKNKKYGNNSIETASSYYYLGEIYFSLEDYKKAIDFYNKALRIRESHFKKNSYRKALLKYGVGLCYINLELYDRALEILDSAATYDDIFLNAEIHRLKGGIQSETDEFDRAWDSFEKALGGFQKMKTDNSDYIFHTYRTMIESLMRMDKYEEALTYLDKALAIGTNRYKDTPYELFDLFRYKGTCYFQLNKQDEALAFYLQANELNGGNLSWDDANLKQLKNQVNLNIDYANFYLAQIASPKSSALLFKTDSLLSKTIALIDYIRRNYQERGTKEDLVERFYEVFRKALKVKYLLYETTGKDQYLKAAFQLSEKSKNLTLLETLKNVKAFQASNIPDSILAKENELRTNITFLENKRFEASQLAVLDENSIGKLNGEIFDLKQEYEQLLTEIEQKYPDYYQLKFESPQVTVKTIQKNILAENQSLLEYFLGDTTLYVFLIKKDTFQAFRLPKTENLDGIIREFCRSIYSYRPAYFQQNRSNDTLIQTFVTLGQQLFKELIAPFQKELTEKVCIIPDGSLGYLPFDALLLTPPEEEKNFRSYHYLVEKYLTSCAYSVTWLWQVLSKEKRSFQQPFLGIAPVFDKPKNSSEEIYAFRTGLGPLKYNKEEVENIRKTIGGKTLIGPHATRNRFLELVTGSQIIHLATHGKSNDNQGDYSYIAFSQSPDSMTSRFLYVKDFFNVRVPAELVVLSACETGLGEIKRGEGIVSIGKGFSYAGARSLVTTLWRVNDNTTARFMPLFYKNLKKSLPKDEALWQAKKTFIQTNRDAHPFFWAGYIAFGDMQSIDFQSNFSIYWYLGIGLLILAALTFLRKRTN